MQSAVYVQGYLRTASVEAYDPAFDTWTTKASLSDPVSGVGAAVVDNILYVFGGFVSHNTTDYSTRSHVQSYDPSKQFGTTRSPMIRRKDAHGIGTVTADLHNGGIQIQPDHSRTDLLARSGYTRHGHHGALDFHAVARENRIAQRTWWWQNLILLHLPMIRASDSLEQPPWKF